MFEEATTQQGVEPVEEPVVESVVESYDDPAVSPPVSARAAIMQKLAAKRKAEMQPVEPAVEPEPTVEIEPSAPPADMAADAEPAPVQPPVYQKDGVWMTKRKVNGIEEEVKFEELVAINQKMAAADARLREAAAESARVKAFESRVLADAARQQQARQKESGKSQAEEGIELAKKYHALLMKGDLEEEETQNQLAELLVKMNAPSVNADAIVTTATQRAMQEYRVSEWNKDLRKADEWVQTNHREIWDDTFLKQLATNEAQRIMQERIAQGRQTNPNFSAVDVNPRGVYEEAVKKTENWLKAKVPPKTGNDPATSQEARVERKRTASGKTVAGNGAKVTLNQPPKPKTQAEVIADMRRARGLPV